VLLWTIIIWPAIGWWISCRLMHCAVYISTALSTCSVCDMYKCLPSWCDIGNSILVEYLPSEEWNPVHMCINVRFWAPPTINLSHVSRFHPIFLSHRFYSISLVPRPLLKSRKRVWCSERHFLSHGAGPYFVKNVIIAFLNPVVEFLMPQSIWTTTQPDLQKLEMVTKSIWDSRKKAVRQVFTISDSFQNTIAYVMQS